MILYLIRKLLFNLPLVELRLKKSPLPPVISQNRRKLAFGHQSNTAREFYTIFFSTKPAFGKFYSTKKLPHRPGPFDYGAWAMYHRTSTMIHRVASRAN